MARKKKRRSGSKALSINIAKWAAVLYTLGKVTSGVSLSGGMGGLTAMGENFKSNWKEIALLNGGVAILGLALGRYAPRAGIKGALSVKAF